MGYIITPAELRKYAATRLLPKGSDPSGLKELKRANIKMMMTEDEFRQRNGLKQEIEQDFRRESIFIQDGNVHIPITRGFYRLKHYEDIVRHLNDQGLDIDLKVEYYGGDPESARARLDHFAKNLAEEIISTGRNFDMIFIGPLRSSVDTFFGDHIYAQLGISEKEFAETKEETILKLKRQEDLLASRLNKPVKSIDDYLKDERIDPLVVSNLIHSEEYDLDARGIAASLGVERVSSDFLDYQIFEVNGKDCLGLNYVYGDQVFYLLKHFFNEYVEKDNMEPLDVLMYGKVGALSDGAMRGDVIVPSGIVKGHEYFPMDAELLLAFQRKSKERYHIGGNVFAVDSVLDQTYEGLSDAQAKGCSLTEMEAYNVAKALSFCRKNIKGMPKIRFNFIGYASDVPLAGDTLADELYDYSVIYEALDEAAEIILER